MNVRSDILFRRAHATLGEPLNLPVVIACGASNDFAMQLTVSLHSALVHLPKNRPVQVIVMDGGISDRNKTRIRRCLKGVHPHVRIEIVTPSARLLAGIPTTDRYPVAVYLRLLAPAVVPEGTERMLYLDADVLVTEDLSPLFDMDDEGYPLWAVPDPTDGTERGMARIRRSCPWIRCCENAGYFNGGVMLINVPEWRRRHVSERTLDLIRAHGAHFRYFEQDPMNLVLNDDWGRLETKWNNILQKGSFVLEGPADPAERSGILHFTGPIKPWHWNGCCAREESYLEGLRATGWFGPLGRFGVGVMRAGKHAIYRHPRLLRLAGQLRRRQAAAGGADT